MAGTAEQDLGSIVESAAEGDEVVFGRIVAAYQEQMYCICVVVCRDRSLAEEAVQSAWSKIWRRLGTLREPARLRPWVVSVAVNEAKSLLRKRRRHSEHEIPVDTSVKPGGIDPATGIAGIDLRDAMRRLDPDDRALVCDYGGEVCAGVAHGNLVAVQFHPEKSQHAGHAFLKAWLAL